MNGLRWGKYVGSPEMPQPTCRPINKLGTVVGSLVALPNGPVFGVESSSALITLHAKPQGL